MNGEHRQSGCLFHPHVGGPGHHGQHFGNSFRFVQQNVEIVSKHFDRHIASHSGDQFVEAHLNGLGEFIFVAGQGDQLALHLGHQIGARFFGVGPLGARTHHHKHIGDARRHGIGGDLRRTDFGEHIIDFGKLFDFFLEGVLHGYRLVQSGAGNAQGMDRHVLFVQRGDELGPQARSQQKAQGDQNPGQSYHGGAVVQGQVEQRCVDCFRQLQKRIFLFRDAASGKLRHHRRYKGHR